MDKKEIKPKPEFLERMKKLLNSKDFDEYKQSIQEPLLNSIRCNTLKISPEQLKKRLEEKNWKISQPWSNNLRDIIAKPNLKNPSGLREEEHPEVMIIESELQPGELGRSIEHLLGYYYVQELASMLSIIALKPKPHELILDLCASPGSKTSQTASQMKKLCFSSPRINSAGTNSNEFMLMQNTGTIVANDINIGRIKILASNLERCGVTNSIITRDDGIRLCEKFKSQNIKFDKILLDAPCSGEGTIRSSPKTSLMWNPNTIKSLSKLQKKLFKGAFEILKTGGEIVYSTCTHAPEENEEVVEFALNEFNGQIEIEKIDLPVKCREGITSWNDKKYNEKVKLSCRIYPQDNDTEGFFIAKFKKIK